jgi:hypothetical protein
MPNLSLESRRQLGDARGANRLAFVVEVRSEGQIALLVRETCGSQQAQTVRRLFWLNKPVPDQDDPRFRKLSSASVCVKVRLRSGLLQNRHLTQNVTLRLKACNGLP